MNNEALKALFLELDGYVGEFFTVAKQIEHMAFLVTPKEKLVQKLEWADDDEKAFQLALLRAKMRDLGVIRYGMIGEAWMAFPVAGQVIAPSKSERRTEVVFISVTELNGASMTGWHDIETIKRRGQLVRTLGPLMSPDDVPGSAGEIVQMAGTMLNLLEDPS